MPRKKNACPQCGEIKSAEAKLCRNCSTPYERTPERNERMSQITKGNIPRSTGWHHSPETRQKMSSYWTPERRAARSIETSLLAEDREWLVKIAIALSGERNPNYQGKGQASPYAPGWGRGYRAKLRARAKGICERCNKQRKLDLHHKDFGKSDHSPENLMAVCRSCHKILHAANSSNT